MKTLVAATLIGLVALTATAATSEEAPRVIRVDDAEVNAKIDLRQNELMRALLTAKRATRLAHVSR